MFVVALGLLTAAFTLIGEARGQSSVSSGFTRVINQYRWNYDLDIRERGPGWAVDFQNRFRSDAFIQFGNRLNFRDEDQFSLTLRRPINSVEMVLYSRGGWYSLSDVVSTSTYAGIRLGKSGPFWIEPLLGVSLDRRPGIAQKSEIDPLRTDAGPAAGFNAGFPLSTYDGYEIELFGRGRYEVLSPRRSDLLRLYGTVRKSYNQLRTRISFRASSMRRDAYQSASFLNRSNNTSPVAETIESTRSDTFDIALDLTQAVSSVFSIGGRLTVGLNRRHVRILSAPGSALVFDTDFSRDDINAEINGEYAAGALFFRFSLSAGAQIEDRQLRNQDDLPTAQVSQKILLLRQADFDRGVVEVRVLSRAPLGRRTLLQLDVSTNIVRHDTPEVNPDDRDELFYRGQIGSTTRLTDQLEIQLQLFGTYFHTVYLKSVRSVDNNVQRSLRFRPTVRWRPGRGTRVELVSQVRATYTVHDFVLPGRRSVDQSARELRYDLDMEHEIPDLAVLKFTGRLSDLRLGRFLNDAFAEIPFDSLRTTDLWGRIQVGQRLQAEIGFRSFVRTDFDRALNVKYTVEAPSDGASTEPRELITRSVTREGRRIITQNGPTASLRWNMRRASHLRLEGWAIIQRISYRLYGDLPEEDADIIRRAASKGTRTLLPNLTITMFWRL